jgi:hypothetical protein
MVEKLNWIAQNPVFSQAQQHSLNYNVYASGLIITHPETKLRIAMSGFHQGDTRKTCQLLADAIQGAIDRELIKERNMCDHLAAALEQYSLKIVNAYEFRCTCGSYSAESCRQCSKVREADQIKDQALQAYNETLHPCETKAI